jgi:hypothetical protein
MNGGERHAAGEAAERYRPAHGFSAVSGGLLRELGAVQRVGRAAGRSGDFNDMEQGKRHSRLNLAHGSVTKQISQMTGSVYAKDEEDLVAAGDADMLAGSGLLLAVVFARGRR